MIQRIQSVYLIIALCLMVSTYFVGWVTYEVDDQAIPFRDTSTALILQLTHVASVVLCVLSILQFKARGRQMATIRWTMVSECIALAIFAAVHYINIQELGEKGELSMSYNMSVILPVVNLVLLWLAHRSVKKDDDLVKSVDRLR